ncbi:hypothetical protein D3C84_1033950 [compost metagenome]
MHFDDCHGLFLERAAGGHEANLALPFRVGEFHHRFGQVFFIDQFGIERNHADSRGDADPGAIAGDVVFWQNGEGGGIGLRQ